MREERSISGGVIEVKVVTRSSRPRVEEVSRNCYTVHVSAAPHGGKANSQLVEAVACHLGVPKTGIRIARGASSRNKTLIIEEYCS